MAKVELAKGRTPLSAKLTLNLTSYCDACLLLQRKKVELKVIQDAFKSATDEEIHYLHEAHTRVRMALEKARSALDLLHEDIQKELTELTGALHWFRIKGLLGEQCEGNDPGIKQLLTALQAKNRGIAPLAIESLDTSFVELLKNSIDAMVYQSIEQSKKDVILEMDIRLELMTSSIAIIITDNAGGFPNTYLETFAQDLRQKNYQLMPEESWKKKDKEYYFGGAGLGMNLLCDYLLDGAELDSSRRLRKLYLVKDGETAITIANTELGGAKISLLSPLNVLQAAPEEKCCVNRPPLLLNTIGFYSLQERRAAKRRGEIVNTVGVEPRGQVLTPKLFSNQALDEGVNVGRYYEVIGL